jgi:hypothetical protein
MSTERSAAHTVTEPNKRQLKAAFNDIFEACPIGLE